MFVKKAGFYGLILLLTLVLTAPMLSAAPGKRGDKHRTDKYYKRHGYVLDHRHRHDHYYPRRGVKVKVLPRDYRTISYRNSRYYFSSGVWYRSSGSRFIVTLPPIGLVVPFLPHAYTTIWVGSIPYYYAAGTYYSWVPRHRAYRVVGPPPEAEVVEDPEVPNKLFVYPKQGQSEQQQASDRYQCHNWARGQTGFDPTQPGGGVEAEQNTARRSEYNRAMKACLEARGYSVQ